MSLKVLLQTVSRPEGDEWKRFFLLKNHLLTLQSHFLTSEKESNRFSSWIQRSICGSKPVPSPPLTSAFHLQGSIRLGLRQRRESQPAVDWAKTPPCCLHVGAWRRGRKAETYSCPPPNCLQRISLSMTLCAADKKKRKPASCLFDRPSMTISGFGYRASLLRWRSLAELLMGPRDLSGSSGVEPSRVGALAPGSQRSQPRTEEFIGK